MGERTIPLNILLYQIVFIGVIWGGMFFFLDDIFGSGKIIFYVVTSWFLFLIVILIKGLIKGDFKKEDE